MKKIFVFAASIALLMVACDKVENPYPDNFIDSGDLDQSLYPGNWQDYLDNEWPTFDANPNTDRNVMIEDFTGHKCKFCPAAADVAHQIEIDNPGRVFISTIHSGPNGISNFQETSDSSSSSADFSYDFTNEISLAIGKHFGETINGSGFNGNPSGTVSRVSFNGSLCMNHSDWNSATQSILTANDLKVNLQSAVNFYDQTNGGFLHIEAEILDENLDPNDLGLVVAVFQDSIVKPQLYPAGTPGTYKSADTAYVHRDLLKTHLNGGMSGSQFTAELLDESNGKYYYDYSFKLGTAELPYTADNMHFLIYVILRNQNPDAQEVLHVIKQKIK